MTPPVRAQFLHPVARTLRVLLADDNHDSTDSLAELLGLVGYDVRGCYDGGAVLPLAKRFRPDACVLDVGMPVLDGWEVGVRLRAWAGERPLLLVALTGLGGPRAAGRSRSAGFDHHLLKPGDPLGPLADFAAAFERFEPVVLAHRPRVTFAPREPPLLPAVLVRQ
jgi:CheY-like chemotaxis protein